MKALSAFSHVVLILQSLSQILHYMEPRRLIYQLSTLIFPPRPSLCPVCILLTLLSSLPLWDFGLMMPSAWKLPLPLCFYTNCSLLLIRSLLKNASFDWPYLKGHNLSPCPLTHRTSLFHKTEKMLWTYCHLINPHQLCCSRLAVTGRMLQLQVKGSALK